MKIKVLGTGCQKCKKLYAEVEKAIASSGVKVDLEKVEKIEEIIKYGIMATPGLVINEEIKASGRIPQSDEILSWITTAAKSTRCGEIQPGGELPEIEACPRSPNRDHSANHQSTGVKKEPGNVREREDS